MKPWVRYALTFGAASALMTVLFYGLGVVTATGPGCSSASLLPSLSPIGFVVLMVVAGFLTTRSGAGVGQAALAGLVASFISGIGLLLGMAIVLASGNISQCTNGTDSGLAGLAALTVGTFTLVITVVNNLLGLGVGAGLAAIGGVFGRRPGSTLVSKTNEPRQRDG